jgi:predicted acetyltransferase
MSRVLDVAKLSGMEAGEGSFSARIIDPLCPWNEGVWLFEGGDGRLQVSKASQADCELTIQGLTALIAGVHDPQDIPLREWGNPNVEIQTIQRKLFPHMVPYMHEMF